MKHSGTHGTSPLTPFLCMSVYPGSIVPSPTQLSATCSMSSDGKLGGSWEQGQPGSQTVCLGGWQSYCTSIKAGNIMCRVPSWKTKWMVFNGTYMYQHIELPTSYNQHPFLVWVMLNVRTSSLKLKLNTCSIPQSKPEAYMYIALSYKFCICFNRLQNSGMYANVC